MNKNDTTELYSEKAYSIAKQYESVSFETLHRVWLRLIPSKKMTVLDVGAGSGRDAAWFAKKGNKVVAVEPADTLRHLAEELHHDLSINWIDDLLPELTQVYKLHTKFDLILLSGVWMHVVPTGREKAFRKLVGLLNQHGILIISLRQGVPPDNRVTYPAKADELFKLADYFGLEIKIDDKNKDYFDRKDISWRTIVFQLSH